MKIDGKPSRTIWLDEKDPTVVKAIDQTILPHRFAVVELRTVQEVYRAIADMIVRGAPLIGVAAGFGMYLAALEARKAEDFPGELRRAGAYLRQSRPTAVNLAWAIDEQLKLVDQHSSVEDTIDALRVNAVSIADGDVAICRSIGQLGLEVIKSLHEVNPNRPVEILTHCNAGWLCAVEFGTATAPIYAAHEAGIPVHVWVDETRPRNQGAALTAWELGKHGVPFTLITDNCGGHLMQNGMVDMAIVGTDRVSRGGDVANKIGTYLKALAAKANAVPFYVAAPSSSIDWQLVDGRDIPIETRDANEVLYVSGLCEGDVKQVLIAPEGADVANYGFDVTPRHLVTGIITERGICEASETGLLNLFPEKKKVAAT